MSTVNSVGSAAGIVYAAQAAPGAMTVAKALSTLKLQPGSTVTIADSLANIHKNLDALQGMAARITGLETTDATQQLTVSAAQYQKDSAILALWGAGSGNTVDVTGVSASAASAFAAARPDYVTTFTVSDSAANVQKNLAALQGLASDHSLRQIVLTGSSSTLKMTAAQLAASGDALGLIKNQAYALAVTEASVSDTLGLDGQTALASNSKIKAIDVKDGTDAIEANLDALQKVGLRLKSISQTDSSNPLTLTAAQYSKDAIAIGKILTPVQLDVIRANAAQAAKLAANQKVVTVSVQDTASHIAARWKLLDQLGSSLTAVEVTDGSNPITITGDQLTLGDDLLAKFTVDADHGYALSVTGVKAGQAASVAALDHVTSIKVTDTADNLVANLDDLATVADAGLLKGISLSGKSTTLTLDAARLTGAGALGTQAVLGNISSGRYGLAVTGVAVADLADVTANSHVVSMEVAASGADIAANLDTLYQQGKRLTRIQQSDSGGVLELTQSAFESRASVLAKIDGGYTARLSGVSAAKAQAYAMNSHIESLTVADTGKNLAAKWTALRSIGDALTAVSKTDTGSLILTATDYLAAQVDQLLDKFDDEQTFAVLGASVAQAAQIAEDDAVDRLAVTDDGSAVAAALDSLAELADGGKLQAISLNTGATNLALHADQLDDAQGVLDLVKGGRYTLSVDQVDVADAAALLTGNAKIVRLAVSGDAEGIAGHLTELASAGHRLQRIEQSDANDNPITLTGNAFELNKTTLAKIAGGYQVALTDVSAAKAATLAASTAVKSLQVADSGANLATAWATLGTLGSKLGGIAQSDSTPLQLTAQQWSSSHNLVDLFSSDVAASISGAGVGDLEALGDDDAVQQIQLEDSADAIADAWAQLAAQTKLTQVRIADPGTAMAMTAQTLADSSSLLAKVQGGSYKLALSDVAVADAATLAADTHVTSLAVAGSSSDVAAAFDSLQAMAKLDSIALSDSNGSLQLSAGQVLGGASLLGKISSPFQITATGVSLAQLDDMQALDEVTHIAISDSAANVGASFDDLATLADALTSIHLSDSTPLALTQQAFAAGTSTLDKIDGSYQVDLSQVQAGSVATLADEDSVHQLAVADSADNIAANWDALVLAYNGGSGKLAALALNDSNPITLTEAQQTAGAALITALLPEETILTAA